MSEPQNVHMTNRNIQIGDICSQWAHLEYILANAIWALLGLDKATGLIVTGGLNIENRVGTAVALAEKMGQPTAVTDALKHVRKELQASKIIQRRNLAVHGHRFPHPEREDAELVEIHRGKDAGQAITRADSELRELGKDIANLHKTLMSVLQDHELLY